MWERCIWGFGGGVHTGPVGGYSSEALPNVHGRSPAEILKQASGNMFLQYPLIRLSASFTSLPLSSATHCPPPHCPTTGLSSAVQVPIKKWIPLSATQTPWATGWSLVTFPFLLCCRGSLCSCQKPSADLASSVSPASKLVFVPL